MSLCCGKKDDGRSHEDTFDGRHLRVVEQDVPVELTSEDAIERIFEFLLLYVAQVDGRTREPLYGD